MNRQTEKASWMAVLMTAIGSGANAQEPSSLTNELTEIVVTAQRRNENLQEVPISVTALSGDELQKLGATTSEDLQAVAPGFIFTQNMNSVTPFVRGVGTNDASAAAEGAISLYVDGVYYSSMTALAMSLNDVERVELLRGPQGTLFGRNSTGGALQVVTRKPSQEFGADVKVGYANYETFTTNAYVTGGITDRIAVSLSGAIRDQGDGWGRNVVNGEKTGVVNEEALRGKILFEPGEDTRFTLAADYVKAEGNREMARNIAPSWSTSDGSSPLGADGVTRFSGSIYDSTTDERYFRQKKSDVEQKGASLRVEQGFGFSDLVSITAYRDTASYVNIDQDGVPAHIVGAFLDQHDETFTQEVQLLSPSTQSFKWQVGGYYLDRQAGNDPFRLFSGDTIVLDRINEQNTRSLAAYAQTTFELIDRLNLTLGGRYTSDRVRFTGQQIRRRPLPELVTTPPTTASRDYEKPTWRVAFDYQVSDDVLAYVSHNRGFKSGTFNSNNPTPTEADPETLDAFEAGVKADLWSRRLRINVSAFDYDYKDLQFQYVVSGVANTINAAKAKIQGFEVETTLLPTRGLVLTAGASVSTKAQYEDFKPTARSPGCPVNVQPPAGGLTLQYVDCSGTGIARTPDFTLNASAAYTIDLSDRGSVDLSGGYYYNDGYKFDPDGLFIQPSYEVVNAATTWIEAAGHLSVSLWAKNLLAEEYFLRVGSSGIGAYEVPAPPRTYGVSLRYVY